MNSSDEEVIKALRNLPPLGHRGHGPKIATPLAEIAARRERIATAAMQAMELPNGLKYSSYDWAQGVPQGWAALAAKMAVLHADALIAELDKGKGG